MLSKVDAVASDEGVPPVATLKRRMVQAVLRHWRSVILIILSFGAGYCLGRSQAVRMGKVDPACFEAMTVYEVDVSSGVRMNPADLAKVRHVRLGPTEVRPMFRDVVYHSIGPFVIIVPEFYAVAESCTGQKFELTFGPSARIRIVGQDGFYQLRGSSMDAYGRQSDRVFEEFHAP